MGKMPRFRRMTSRSAQYAKPLSERPIKILDSIEWGQKPDPHEAKYLYIGIDPGVVNMGVSFIYSKSVLYDLPLKLMLKDDIVCIKSYSLFVCPSCCNKQQKSLAIEKTLLAILPNNATKIIVERQIAKTGNDFLEGLIYGCIKEKNKIIQGGISQNAVVNLLNTEDLPFSYDKSNNKKRKRECHNQIIKILENTGTKPTVNNRASHHDASDAILLCLTSTCKT